MDQECNQKWQFPWKFSQNFDKTGKNSNLTENQMFCDFPMLSKITFFMESLLRR